MSALTLDEMKARVARLRRTADSYAAMRGEWNAEWAADLRAAADALEAAYDAGRRELAERFANQDATRRAAIEELVAGEDEHEAPSAHPAEETEWEWGASWLEGDERVFMPTENDWRAEVEVNRMNMGYDFPDENYVVRRRKAGPWLLVPTNGEGAE